MAIHRDAASALLEANMPERRLMAAVLWNAFHSLERSGDAAASVPGSDSEEALAWFHSDESAYVFSFRHICSQLGIDPTLVLRRIAELARETGPHA